MTKNYVIGVAGRQANPKLIEIPIALNINVGDVVICYSNSYDIMYRCVSNLLTMEETEARAMYDFDEPLVASAYATTHKFEAEGCQNGQDKED